MSCLYIYAKLLRFKLGHLIGLGALLATLSAQAQSTLYVDGVPTQDNEQFETLNLAYQQLTASAPGAPIPAGSYQWLKNEEPQGSTTPYCYVTGPGVYRLRYNGNQLSNCIIVNVGSVANTRNYSITDQALYPGVHASQGLSLASEFATQITYQDGFGRPMQQIAVNASAGMEKDFIQTYSYGPQGEQTKSYLPFVLGKNGDFKANWQSDQNAFYQFSPKVGRPGSNGPTYSEVVADNDPLGRVTEKASPGDSWKLSGGHTKRITRRSNTDKDDVRLWTYEPAAALGSLGTLAWTTTPATANTLSAVETRDEDSNWRVVFTNEKGQTVCRRTYLGGRPDQPVAGASYLETAYAYDEAGRQLAAIPPKAVQQLLNSMATTATGTVLDQYLFLSQYDALGRTIAHKVPGKGWAYTVYDRWDRVAATQDVLQVRRGVWSFYKYDALNRTVMTGEIVDSRDPIALATALQSWPADQRAEQRTNDEIGYTLTQTFPTNTIATNVATVDYYDDYNYLPLSSGSRADLAFVAEMDYAAASPLTRGLRTGSRRRTLSGTYYDKWLTSIAYYDQYGRVVQELKDNASGNPGYSIFAVDRITSVFSLTGEVSRTFLTHRRYNSATGAMETHTTDIQNFCDTRGRLIDTYESIDNAPYVALNSLEYNDLGQVVDKKLGYDNGASSYIQSLDFRYNIRGWLTNINNRNLSNNEWLDGSTPNSDTEPRDAFGLELKYESGSTALGHYNGNISGAIWNSERGRMRQYGYEYDQANRITAGRYSALEYVNGNYAFTAEKDDARREGLYTTSGINYDPNGNITALNRSGLLSRNPSTGAKVFGRIDELAFDHDGNRLRTVTDGILASAATNDFENGPNTGATYIYDDNGNLTRDPNKKVWIYYNQLNLPYYFSFDNGNVIQNLYTVMGEKISSTSYAYSPTTGYTNKTVQYLQGFTYTTSSTGAAPELTVSTPTGRAIFESAATSSMPAGWAHEYHIRDHQGSLRLVLKQEPVLSYRLTMEAANAAEEEAQFKRVATTRQLDASHARTGVYSARLNAYQVERANGPATVLRVAAGDSVSLEVFGLYDKGVAIPKLSKAIMPLVAIGGSLGNASTTGPDGQPRKSQRLLPTITAGVAVAWGSLRSLFEKQQSVPQASFTYELYNKDSVLVKSATGLLTETGQPNWQELQHGFRAKEAGYVKVYLGNASGTNAWFDDMQARVFPVPTKQENHYDPFGQNLEEIEVANGNVSKEQYTGQEKVDDFSLNLYDYSSRYYDFQLGRFNGIDAAAADYTSQGTYNYCLNNPVSHTDPDGKNPILIGAAVLGAGLNIYSQYKSGNIHSGWEGVGDVLIAGGVGAVSATVAAATGIYLGPIIGGGLIGGAAVGYASNYAGGFSSGYLNNAFFGDKTFKGSINAGMRGGNASGLIGAVVGGFVGSFSGFYVPPTQRLGNIQPSKIGTDETEGFRANFPNGKKVYEGLSQDEFDELFRETNAGYKTFYRGTTGSETDGGTKLFLTDNPAYAQGYIQNNGQLMQLRIPITEFNSYVKDGLIQTARGEHTVTPQLGNQQEWVITSAELKRYLSTQFTPYKP